MFDVPEKSLEADALALVLTLFPAAEEATVSSLPIHSDALDQYLATANSLTLAEVREVMEAFISGEASQAELPKAS